MAAEADAGDPGDPHSRKATPCAPSLLFSTSNVKLFLILFVDTKKKLENYLFVYILDFLKLISGTGIAD